jgi:Ca2+-binding RTX toxin-like protein
MNLLESLEQRRLLTASFSRSTGIVTILGTDAVNVVGLANNGATFSVVETTGGQTVTTNFDTARVTRIVVKLLRGADTLTMGKVSIPANISGGPGADRLSAGRGNDTIFGNGGDDYIFGSFGRDLIDGGSEGDDMLGGGDRDTVDYSTRTNPLTIGLGTLPDDGEAGEGDNVRSDFEVVLGGSGSDTISHGGSRPINLYGNAGNDTLTGGPAGDFLVGGPGADQLNGLGEADAFDTEDGERDTVEGGDGVDTVLKSDSDDILNNI